MAKTKKTEYPFWFRGDCLPVFSAIKPDEYFSHGEKVSAQTYMDGDWVEFDPAFDYRLDVELDYSGCYYPGESPSVKCFLVAYTKEKMENPLYAEQLANYEREKRKHKKQLEEWKKWKIIWDAEQEKLKKMQLRRKEIAERKMFEKLREKYEQK